MHRVTALVLFVLCGLAAAACASAIESVERPATTTTAAPETTTTTTTTELQVVTTIRQVPAEELASAGQITIADTQFDFAFECFAAGAGDILALGVGHDPETERSTQAIVQMFFGQPFVSVIIDDDQILELAVDAPAELFLRSGVIRGSALRFVEASETVGVGEPLGLGTVTVECDSFAPGLPDEYVVAA